jgi:glycosyltransferase involved in cell wall biosynthesis
MRYGAGMQFKVLEAMAMETPVVSTPQALTALQVQPGQDLLTGDTPQEIATAVITLLNDDTLRQRLGQAGRRYVETYHDWHMTAEKLAQLYREVIAETKCQAVT